jgi:hypothetical protein
VTDVQCFSPEGEIQILKLKNVPILPSIRYNLLAEHDCTAMGMSVIKEKDFCWILIFFFF